MKARNNSKKRDAILNKLRSTDNHPTAEWLYQELKSEYPDLSLGTIYRNIGIFKEQGSVVSVGTVAGQERFDGALHPHGHFVCRLCRAVIDVDALQNEAELDTRAKLEESRAVRVERMELTFHGICAACWLA